MKLRNLLAKVDNICQLPNHPALEAEVKGLTTNSHACHPGDLFIGMPGTRVDGGEFWQSALASGAVAALISPAAASKGAGSRDKGAGTKEQAVGAGLTNQLGSQQKIEVNPPSWKQGSEPCVIAAADMVKACAQVAAAFYGYPAQRLKLVGVTGTNGKTTTTHLIEFFLTQAQLPIALMGTLYTRWAGFEQTAAHTTPFAVELQHQLALAVEAGCELGVMEVSSHALAQGRVMCCPFEVAVFTNLTQDHLDFHRDLEDYFAAKSLLFKPDYLQGRAIVNADDPYGQRLSAQIATEQLWRYSVQDKTADLWTSDLNYEPSGVSGILHTPKGEVAFRSPLVGQYNLSNLLAAVGAVLHLGIDLQFIAAALPQFPGVPGRMERVQISENQDISVIVDYAHTPDSLENLLRAARPFIPGKMICVFGCGGDRDRTKRPKMGQIAAANADVAVVTSDNPRTEDPERILQDILGGIPAEVQPVVMCDRAVAIRSAILQAEPGDGILIAGKGHEDYQILGTEKIHFDDREQARAALSERLRVLGVSRE